jgi:hypothetical protein
MSGPVAAALIAALGTLLVGLINYLVSRVQSRDARTRLQKDVEVFEKLEKDTLEFRVMEEHIQRSVLSIVYTELADIKRFKERTVSMSKIMFAGFATCTSLVLWVFVRRHETGGWHHPNRSQPWHINWGIDFGMNSLPSNLLLALFIIFYFLFAVRMTIRGRQEARGRILEQVEKRISEFKRETANEDV